MNRPFVAPGPFVRRPRTDGGDPITPGSFDILDENDNPILDENDAALQDEGAP